MTDTVSTARAGATLRVTLSRPERLNAIDTAMKRELLAVFRAASEEPIVSVVLTGSGRAFCAGADLAELEAAKSRGDDALQRLQRVELTQSLVRLIRSSTFVSVAAVNGVAAGGGISLALACDIVLMSDQARLVWAFGDRHLVPDAGLCDHLRDVLGSRRATSLMLRTSQLTADEALGLGLVDEVLSPAELDLRVSAIESRLGTLGQPVLALTKRALGMASQHGQSVEAIAQGMALDSVHIPPGGEP